IPESAAQIGPCGHGNSLVGTSGYEGRLIGQRVAIFKGAYIQKAVAEARGVVNVPDIFKVRNNGMSNATPIYIPRRIRTLVSTRGRRSQIIISQQSIYKTRV